MIRFYIVIILVRKMVFSMKIKHDFHVHTNLSLCGQKDATVAFYMERAAELGLEKIGFSNHFWDEKVVGGNESFYKTQNFAHVAQIRAELEQFKRAGIRTYFGCEGEYDPVHHGIAMTEEAAEKFDYILIPNSHTHLTMPREYFHPYEKCMDFMINAYNEILDCNISRYITAMAHPFVALGCPYDSSILIERITDDQYKRLFDKTAEKGIAIEINGSLNGFGESDVPGCSQMRIFAIAKECGCKFLFGSDSHSRAGQDFYEKAEQVADILGLTQEDIAEIAR